MRHTFGLIKPDAVRRSLSGILISQIEAHGFTLEGLRFGWMLPYEVENLYYKHKSEPYYERLCDTMQTGPCVFMCLSHHDSGMNVPYVFRLLALDLRNQFKAPTNNQAENVIHATSDDDSPYREIEIFFPGIVLA